MLEIIKQKIKEGKGFVKRLDTGEIITAKKFDNLTNKKHKDYESNNIMIQIFTKHDYKLEDDNLVLLTDKEKLINVKEKKKKEIANLLLSKYPEKQINNTLNTLYQEKCTEIEILNTIEEVKNYQID